MSIHQEQAQQAPDMLSLLIPQVRDVLDEYGKDYQEGGIKTNLKKWLDNKGWLVELLRKHPNWNEDALAIIFDVTESRELERGAVDSHKSSLFDLALNIGLSSDDANAFYDSVSKACQSFTKTLTDKDQVEAIKETSGIPCAVGQKTSRVINAIAKKYGVDKHPEYNARFAKLADALNPLQIKKKALLSVHPCDYLQMANKKNSWSSCHRLDGGEYHGGTLSYMNDNCTMIFYTVDCHVTEDYANVAKRTRQCFAYKDGILLQSRLYPNTDDEEIRNVYRDIVQRAITLCADIPNLWTLKREHEAVERRVRTHEDALQYRDYEHKCYKSNISILTDAEVGSDDRLVVGYTAYCVECREWIERNGDENNSIYCEGCCDGNSDYRTCYDCDERAHEDEMYWIGDEWYCQDCTEYCDHCEERTRDEMTSATNSRGNDIYICEDCRDDHFYYCEHCDEYYDDSKGRDTDWGFCCDGCFDNNFICCHGCDSVIRHGDSEEIDGDYYCDDCAEGRKSEENEEE